MELAEAFWVWGCAQASIGEDSHGHLAADGSLALRGLYDVAEHVDVGAAVRVVGQGETEFTGLLAGPHLGWRGQWFSAWGESLFTLVSSGSPVARYWWEVLRVGVGVSF